MQITTIGIDLAKTVFQVHAVDADGATVIRKRLRRAEVLSFVSGLEPCLIGMEACATSHYWARELAKFGHTVKLMPRAYVKPYVKRGKNVVPQGIRHVRALIERVFGEGAHAVELPALARTPLRPLVAQLMELRSQIKTIEKELLAWHRTTEESKRLETIPGVGFITATAIAATVTDPSDFRSGREFAAWLGLIPRQNSLGGKERLGRISIDGQRLSTLSHCRRSHGDDPLRP
jgi:transposase